jgi:hypothetical protein
MMAFGE